MLRRAEDSIRNASAIRSFLFVCETKGMIVGYEKGRRKETSLTLCIVAGHY
jgi:hypothetical protein